MVDGWLNIENNIDLGKVYFYTLFADDMTQENPNRCVKDTFLDIQGKLNLSTSFQHHSELLDVLFEKAINVPIIKIAYHSFIQVFLKRFDSNLVKDSRGILYPNDITLQAKLPNSHTNVVLC